MNLKSNVTVLMFFILLLCLFIKCGRVKRVVGGVEMKCGTQPNVASLRNSSNLQHKCGATLISPYFALTAAHCVLSRKDEYILQLNNYCADNGLLPKAEIVEIIKHELFDPITRAHDVSLLRITFHGDITRLKRTTLPRSSFGISGKCKIYGYGYRDLSTMVTSQKLLSGALRIISLDECEKALGPYVAPNYDDGMMCAVGEGVDACQGDSGSPLICSDGTVEGISSYGMSCAVPGLPGVYTSVGAHLQWIQNLIKDDDFN